MKNTEESIMYRVVVSDHFDAAHYIKDYPGKCRNMHGHRWTIQVCLEGENLNKTNILVDFAEVKTILKDMLAACDHSVLNEIFTEDNLTAEFLARWIFVNYGYRLPYWSVVISWVRVWESPDAYVEWSE